MNYGFFLLKIEKKVLKEKQIIIVYAIIRRQYTNKICTYVYVRRFDDFQKNQNWRMRDDRTRLPLDGDELKVKVIGWWKSYCYTIIIFIYTHTKRADCRSMLSQVVLAIIIGILYYYLLLLLLSASTRSKHL